MRRRHYIVTSMALLASSLFMHTSFAEEVAIKDGAVLGKSLFNSICLHCHSITYDDSAIGAPGLQGVLERHDEAWLNQWLKSPESFAKNNVTARDLIDANAFGLAMPTLPMMQDDEKRAAVIDYLKTLK